MSSLKTTTLQPESGHVYVDGGLSVSSTTSINGSLDTITTSSIGGLATLLNNARSDGPVSCATAPTLGVHLANKNYTDGVMKGSGRLVFFGVYIGGTNGYKASITLPAGTFKMKVEALYSEFLASGNGSSEATVTLSSTWGSSTSVSNTRTHYMTNAVGTCGGYFKDAAIISGTSATSFTLNDSTTADFSVSLTDARVAGVGNFLEFYWCKVYFYAV
jgi:hypothetical protein